MSAPDDITRIEQLLERPLSAWATALLRAMRRNLEAGFPLTEMHRSALDRIETLHRENAA